MSIRDGLCRSVAAGVAGVALAICMSTFATTTASAGEYHVYSCRTPSGEVAPTEGWEGKASGATADNSCRRRWRPACGGRCGLAQQSRQRPSPAGPSRLLPAIRSHTPRCGAPAMPKAAATQALATFSGWPDLKTGNYKSAEAFDECVAFGGWNRRGSFTKVFRSANEVQVPTPNLGTHLPTASCESPTTGTTCPSGGGDENGYAAVVDLYAADIVLSHPPHRPSQHRPAASRKPAP